MFCKYCGKESGDSEVCEECKAKQTENTANTEANTQEAIEVNATRVENSSNTTSSNKKGKSKIAAGLLGIFLGAFGVHNFYLGYTGKAVAQLLISLLSCGFLAFASSIWGLVEGIMILTGSIDKDADGNPLAD